MRKFYKQLGLILGLFFLLSGVKAQLNYASVTNFEVLPQYLNPVTGKIKISTLSPTTTIQYKVSFVRQMGASGIWKETDMIVGLVCPTLDGSTIFNNTKYITNESFPGGSAYLNDVIVTAIIPKDKLGLGSVYLIWTYGSTFHNTQRYSASNTSYQFELYEPQPVVGTPPAYEAPVSGSVPLYEYVSDTKRLLTTTYYSSYPPYTYGGVLGFVFTTATGGTVPLYKFVNTTNGNNYYTIVNEGTITGYSSEGIACYVYPNQVTKSLPVYEHHITGAPWHLYANVPGIMTGYDLHDIRFYILQNKQVTTYPLPEEDCAEVYRYYNANIGDHYYTTLKTHYPGYFYEGILGYVSTIQKPGTVPLYRYWNAADGDHYYPLVKQNYTGYVYEGIVGYVYPSSGVSGTAPVYSYYSDSDTDHYYEMLNSNFNGYVNEGIRFYMLEYNH